MVGVSVTWEMTSSDMENDLGGLEARVSPPTGMGALLDLETERLSRIK